MCRLSGFLGCRNLLVAILAASVLPVAAEIPSTLPPELRQNIDHAANEVLTKTGVPSASVAIVKDGKIA